MQILSRLSGQRKHGKSGLVLKNMTSKRTIVVGIVIAIILIISIANAMFSGSHELFKNKETPQQLCSKCHSSSVVSVSAGVHNPVNCICHGYNPNSSSIYNVNMTHNLTKKIYCTNCHTKYNETTGNVTIAPGVNGNNQSAHYIMSTADPQLSNNSQEFFQ